MIRPIEVSRQAADRSHVSLLWAISRLGKAKSRKKTDHLIRPRSMHGLEVVWLVLLSNIPRQFLAASISSMGLSMKVVVLPRIDVRKSFRSIARYYLVHETLQKKHLFVA